MSRGYKKPVLLLHPLGGWTKDDDVPLSVSISFTVQNIRNTWVNTRPMIQSIHEQRIRARSAFNWRVKIIKEKKTILTVDLGWELPNLIRPTAKVVTLHLVFFRFGWSSTRQ